MFAYRIFQAGSLLDLPDFGGGGLDDAQRKEMLSIAVSFKRPLSALVLFLGVVALEDFIRDLAARLADEESCRNHFPGLEELRGKRIERDPEEMFKRLDTDPAGTLDPEELNRKFKEAISVEPVPVEEFRHLRDLVLLRHTTAHHGSIIREVDRPRFAYFIVEAGNVINPPPEFVRGELKYLFDLGTTITETIRNGIFKPFISEAGSEWSKKPSEEIWRLIEIFGYFGYLETPKVTLGLSEFMPDLREREEKEISRMRDALRRKCICTLRERFGP